jgi:uncharacterized protein
MKVLTNIRLFITISLLFSLSVSGQHLRRKGSLGIAYVAASDSLMRSLRVLDTHGIVIQQIAPNSTAAQLGLQQNDVLVGINESDTLYEYDFLKATEQLYENDPIAVTLVRNRRKSRVVGKVLPAPRESSVEGQVLYDEVAYQRGYLRSIVHRPRGANKAAAIFYLQDYNCNSIDFALDSLHPTKQLIDGWVKAGFVVYRIEKSGVGESINTRSCTRLTLLEELAVFEKGLLALKKYNFIDSSRVFLFGHGMGGTVAPLLAAKHKTRGIMAYGATIKPWFEHLIDHFRTQNKSTKEPYQSVDANTRMLTPLLYEWLVAGKNGAELIQNPEFEAILTAKENPLQYQRGLFFGRLPAYFSELNQQNLAQAWGLAAVPTLAIHGELDPRDLEAAQSIATVVNERRAGKGTCKILKNSDQHFVKIASASNALRIQQLDSFGKEYTARYFNPEIVEMTVSWLNQQK